MFVISKFKDIVRVPAHSLGQPIEEVLSEELNRRFANKVVLDVGLVICLYDICNVGESYIFCGDGAVHTRCEYRMIIFRPQIGEVLIGTLRSSSKEGLIISLGFFDSIVVPPQQLSENTVFNEVDQTWSWNFEDDGQTHILRLEIGEQVRFRVHSELFVDVSPHGPQATNIGSANANLMSRTDPDRKEVPYSIVGSIGESGLGLVKWWL